MVYRVDIDIATRVHREMNSEKHVVNKRDIYLYMDCSRKNDFTEMHKTYLYNEKGSIYCRMIELIHRYKGEV